MSENLECEELENEEDGVNLFSDDDDGSELEDYILNDKD
jgi:hypothetical protein